MELTSLFITCSFPPAPSRMVGLQVANDLLHAAMLVASSNVGAPVVVAIDFNFFKSDSVVLQRALESATWSDACVTLAHQEPVGNRLAGAADSCQP